MFLRKPTDEHRARLLAKVVRELLTTEGPFASLADLTDALKARCARLKIGWTNDAINDAYRLIDSNTPLVPACLPPRRVERPPDAPIDRAFAAAFFADLGFSVRSVDAALAVRAKVGEKR